MAQQTIERFVTRATRLYEHERETPGGSSRLGDYVSQWRRWTSAGVRLTDPFGGPSGFGPPLPRLAVGR